MKSLSEKEVEKTVEFVKRNDIENVVETLLFVLGFKGNLLGTMYVKDGIVRMYKNNTLSCRTLYSGIADRFDTTLSCVERSIRHAIGESYANGYLGRLNDLFRYQILDSNYAPTNSEFISSICTWVHIEKSQV